MQDQYNGGASAQSHMSYAQLSRGMKRFARAVRLSEMFTMAGLNRSHSKSPVWGRWGLNAVAIFGIGVIWSQVMWLIVDGPSVETADVFSANSPDSRPAVSQNLDFNILSRSNPFTGTVTQIQASTIASEAPETNLDLQLFGIRSGDGDFQGSAIIRTPDKRQRMFVVGDAIIDGVILDHVLVDRVIVSRSGVRESLLLVPDSARTSLRTQQSNTVPGGAASPNQLNGRSLSAYLSSVRLQPRIQSGTINGFYISEVDQTAVLNGTGLVPGDVVMAVNGVRLVSGERIKDVIDELTGAQEARIEIERDGFPKSVTLSRTAVQQ